MTISPLAAKAKQVIDAAWLHGDAYDLSSQAAFALESTCMLQSPETVAEMDRLRARVAALESERHSTNESLSKAAEALREQRDRITEHDAQREALVERMRAGQRWERGRNPELVSENLVSQSELRSIFEIPLTPPWENEPAPCCHLHKPSCCDPEDCGPCCMDCPTCPVLVRQRREGWCSGCVTDHDPAECGYRPNAEAGGSE